MPTTSAEPDPVHMKFWSSRLTLPVDDPFWDHHHPGERWGCKCTCEQTDEPVNDLGVHEDIPDTASKGLHGNPGQTGQLFSEDHPYYPKNCGSCPFTKGAKNRMRLFLNKEKDCGSCQLIDINLSNSTSTTKQKIESILENVHNHRIINAFVDLGSIDAPVHNFITKRGIQPSSMRLIISDVKLQHALRSSKAAKGIGMPEQELLEALSNLDKCAVYFDTNKQNVWYIWHAPQKSYKLVFDFNKSIKVNRVKVLVNQLTTAGIVNPTDLGLKELIKIR